MRPAPVPGLDRPGGAGRPSTLPAQVGRPGGGLAGSGSRPGGPAPGLGEGGLAARPSGPNRPGIGGDRPGGGGNRPGVGGNRPTTLPGDLADRPGIGGNRPGFGNRPGVGDRPGIGGNRPGIGDGNTFWNNGTIGSGNNNTFTNVNVGGGWGLTGYGGGWGYGGLGYGGWANRWNTGFVNPHYGGWYNGCWGGNWGYNGGWWAPFAAGAATWGLASTLGGWGWGYGDLGYVNPYYGGIPAAVVASSPYDYSQPLVLNNYVTNDGGITDGSADTVQGGTVTTQASATVSEADRLVDTALADFKQGDYAAALAGCDRAVKQSPNDPVIHEVRALALFALGRYPEAAATLNALLATAPGMDWTTMSGLYGSLDDYTQQLRTLEDFCRANRTSAPAYFVLAYHYLVGGHVDAAAEALRVVVARQPDDVVAKRLLDAIDPPAVDDAPAAPPKDAAAAPAAAPPAGPETDLVGTWKATNGGDTVVLVITEDSRFTWKAMPANRPPVEISGTIETARDAIALVSEAAGTMAGTVVSKGADAFDFSLAGAPADAPPIAFERQTP